MTRRPKLRSSGGSLARFVNYKADPARSMGIPADHPAAVEGRTMFPGNVVGVWDSPRLLVDGKNNAKIGGKVLNGDWAGMPVYTLTLEERKTCPRSCESWLSCYGNAMHWPRRNDAFHPDFIAALAAEVITVARLHPAGFVVRLHVLGDFFSVPYVMAWARLLEMLPNLYVYGYTGRRIDDPDPESRKIARALQVLTDGLWRRFSVRTSHAEPGPQRTIVVEAAVKHPDVIMCPSQIDKTAACGTCALCWSPSARGKTIGFLRHGIKDRSAPVQQEESLPMNIDHFWTEERMVVAGRLWQSRRASAAQIAAYLGNGCTRNAVIGKMDRLEIDGGPGRAGRPSDIVETLKELGLPPVCAA